MKTVALAWLVVVAVGCARSHPEREADGNGPAAGDDASTGAGRGGTGAGASAGSGLSPGHPSEAGAGAAAMPVLDAAIGGMGSAGSAGAPLDVPGNAPEPTQVWIGQLWSIAPLLCDPNAPWSDTSLVIQPTGYTERVVLILELRDPEQPSGVIAFGEGELPATPDIPPGGNDSGSFWLCSNQIPSKGGEYTLVDARRSSDRLTFDIVPSEIWNASCPDGDASCHCRELGACVVPPGQRAPVDLLVTGDEMQAMFMAAAFGTAGELRLRRVE